MPNRREFIAATALVLTQAKLSRADTENSVPPLLDHVILGCNDLDTGMAWVESKLGVRPALGGVHPGRGTRNALLSLGKRRYLEIMAPDPQQRENAQTRALKDLKEPRIIGWAAHVSNAKSVSYSLRNAGIAFSGPTPGTRQRPDGLVLKWITVNLDDDAGVLPFFIEWGEFSAHPSEGAPKGVSLVALTAASPKQAAAMKVVDALGLGLQVASAVQPELHATFEHDGQQLTI